MKTTLIPIDSIVVGERQRALSADAVERLAVSMKEIGLRSPITIRVVDDFVSTEGEISDGVPVLVAGAHRHAAAKVLGWTHIDCIDADDDAITAEMWEIAENLHRCDLSKEQRDEHLRRYAELIEARREVSRQNGVKPETGPNGGRPEGVAREVSEKTGVKLRTVQRALAPPRPQLVEVKDAVDAVTAQADAIVRAWNRACPEARALAMEQIEGPVFDNTRAA